jgi:hypothetical protein
LLRDRTSQICAAIGVVLLVAASVLQDQTYAVFGFLVGLAFIAVAHVLTPCRDQITRWWRERVLKQ